MRGTKAKRLRRAIYGNRSTKVRKYAFASWRNDTIINELKSDRSVYQRVKRGDWGVMEEIS